MARIEPIAHRGPSGKMEGDDTIRDSFDVTRLDTLNWDEAQARVQSMRSKLNAYSSKRMRREVGEVESDEDRLRSGRRSDFASRTRSDSLSHSASPTKKRSNSGVWLGLMERHEDVMWLVLKHLWLLNGYSFQLSLFMVIIFATFSYVPWLSEQNMHPLSINSTGAEAQNSTRVDASATVENVLGPNPWALCALSILITVSFMVNAIVHVAVVARGGWKTARTVFIQNGIPACIVCALLFIGTELSVDESHMYWGVEAFVWIFLSTALAILSGFHAAMKRYERSRRASLKEPKSSGGSGKKKTAPLSGAELKISTANGNPNVVRMSRIKRYAYFVKQGFQSGITMLMLLSVTFIYIWIFIPAYRAGSTETKFMLRGIAHPIIEESGAWFFRFVAMENVKHVPENRFKMMLGFFGRLQMSTISNTFLSTMMAVMVSVQELVMRLTMRKRDRFLRRIRGRPQYTSKEIDRQRALWSMSINIGCITENTGIFASFMIPVIFAKFDRIIDFGAGRDFSVVQMLVACVGFLILETIVDMVSFLGEIQQGIPVTVFFAKAMKPTVYTYHLTTVVFISILLLYSFLVIPRFWFCEEYSNPCSCNEFSGLEKHWGQACGT